MFSVYVETTYQDRQSTMLVTIAAVVSSTLGFIILLTIIFGVILFNRLVLLTYRFLLINFVVYTCHRSGSV